MAVFRFGNWGAAQRAARADNVVMVPLSFDRDLDLGKGVKALRHSLAPRHQNHRLT